MWVRVRVIVDVGDDLTSRGLEARVARAAKPTVGSPDEAKPVVLGSGDHAAGRAIVDDDHLVIRIVEPAQAFEAVAERAAAVVAADDHRHPRPAPQPAEGRRGEGLAYRMKG